MVVIRQMYYNQFITTITPIRPIQQSLMYTDSQTNVFFLQIYGRLATFSFCWKTMEANVFS